MARSPLQERARFGRPQGAGRSILVSGPLAPPRYGSLDDIAGRARSQVGAWLDQAAGSGSASGRSDDVSAQRSLPFGGSPMAEGAALVATSSRQDTPAGGGVTSKTMWANGKEYVVISPTRFDPSRSNGATVIPSFEHMRAAEAGKDAVAVPFGTSERVGFVVTPIEGGSVVQPIPRPVTRRLDGKDIAKFPPRNTWPTGAEGLIHGHIDNGRDRDGTPTRSDGMVDAPYGNTPYGDAHSLAIQDPVPMATVSKGAVGWHTLANGQLQFMYPAGALTPSQARSIQRNLDIQQPLFYSPRNPHP